MFAEHNINHTFRNTQQIITQQIQQKINKVQLTLASSPAEGIQAIGGTGILTTNTWVNKLSKQEQQDDLVRWASIMINGRCQNKVSMISAYNPCQRDGNSSTWTLQKLKRQQQGDSKYHPRKQFTKDLVKMIQQKIDQGNHIILGIDANASRARRDDYGLFDKLHEMGLQDVFDKFREECPPTH